MINIPKRAYLYWLKFHDESNAEDREIIKKTYGYQASVVTMELKTLGHLIFQQLPYIGRFFEKINPPQNTEKEADK